MKFTFPSLVIAGVTTTLAAGAEVASSTVLETTDAVASSEQQEHRMLPNYKPPKPYKPPKHNTVEPFCYEVCYSSTTEVSSGGKGGKGGKGGYGGYGGKGGKGGYYGGVDFFEEDAGCETICDEYNLPEGLYHDLGPNDCYQGIFYEVCFESAGGFGYGGKGGKGGKGGYYGGGVSGGYGGYGGYGGKGGKGGKGGGGGGFNYGYAVCETICEPVGVHHPTQPMPYYR